jgi:hypothetical protein
MRTLTLVCLQCLYLLSHANSLLAATYYVATTGDDANPGTQALPFRTIQRGADVVLPGDTVIVRNGVYTDPDPLGDRVVVYVQRGGTSAEWITFKSENKWGAKIDGLSIAQHGFYLSGEASYVRVEGFEVMKMASLSNFGASAVTSYASNVEIVGNRLHHFGQICSDTSFGFTGFFSTNTTNVTIEGNVIHDIGRLDPGESGCMPVTQAYQNHDHGIYLEGVSNVVIKNNVLYSNRNGWAIHLYPEAISNLRIINNTFAFPNPYREGHIILANPLSNSLIENNIFYQPTTAAITYCCGFSLSNVEIRNNLTYGGTISASSPPGGTFSGNLDNTDPNFANVSSNVFDLIAGSPAINAGLALAEAASDFDGVSRPQGSAYDIGAYEHWQFP